MTRVRIFCLKNAMIVANLLATAVGAGLLYIIYEFVILGHQTEQYVEFHIRTSNYFGPIFALFFGFIILYELPNRFRNAMCMYTMRPIHHQLDRTTEKHNGRASIPSRWGAFLRSQLIQPAVGEHRDS